MPVTKTRTQLSLSFCKNLEKRLDEIARTNMTDASAYSYVPCENFMDWAAYTTKVTDPDEMRCAVYRGFQPLYDVLIEDKMSSKHRAHAMKILRKIIVAGTEYLTGYYTQ